MQAKIDAIRARLDCDRKLAARFNMEPVYLDTIEALLDKCEKTIARYKGTAVNEAIAAADKDNINLIHKHLLEASDD